MALDIKMCETPEGRELWASMQALFLVTDAGVVKDVQQKLEAYLVTCIQPTGRVFHHPKRGTTYREMQGEVRLNTARLHVGEHLGQEYEMKVAEDGDMCRLYVDVETGKPSVRPIPEFHDGRFVEVERNA